MTRMFAIAFAAASLLASGAASAGERVTDGALGAASGALVAGPIGFVAGGVIGFVAGPNISHGLGLRHHHHHHHYDYGRGASNRSNVKAAEARPDGR